MVTPPGVGVGVFVGHAPQSAGQFAQLSPAPQVPLGQLPGGAVGTGVPAGGGVGHTPQSDVQLLQLSPAPQLPLPHPAGVGAMVVVGAGVVVGLPLQHVVQQAESPHVPIIIPPLTIAHSPAGAGQFWRPPHPPPELLPQSSRLGQSPKHEVDEHPVHVQSGAGFCPVQVAAQLPHDPPLVGVGPPPLVGVAYCA